MDKKTADAIANILKWAVTQMKNLESERAALEAVLQNYPAVIKQQLDTNPLFKFEVSDQIGLLRASVELARDSQTVQEPIRQKYDTFLARIHELTVDEQSLQAVQTEFEPLTLKKGQKTN